MLSHTLRFHGHGGLRYLYRNGKTSRTRSFLLRFTPNQTRLHSRVTVIVSKKTMKSAARRNRMRRRVYEIIRHEWDQLDHPFDLSVTIYSQDVQIVPYEKLQHEIQQLLSQAHLYKNDALHDKVEKTE